MSEYEHDEMETKARPNLLPCFEGRTDCNALKNGGCIALGNMDFGGRHCPFYKSKAQWEAEEEERLKRERMYRRK